MSANTSAVKEPLIHLTKRSGIVRWKAWLIRLGSFVLAMIVCGLASLLLIDKVRQDPIKVFNFYACFVEGSFSTKAMFWKFMKDMSVLLCIALALTPVFRMRFWNTGAEGQTLVGVLAAIAVNFYMNKMVPEWLLLTLMLFASLAAGALWGAIPALFKAKWNTNETLFTLMMNYVAMELVNFFLIIWVPNGSGTLKKLRTGKLPLCARADNYILIIIVVAVLTVLMYVYLRYSKHGYEISVVGESHNTAKYVGISVKKVMIRTMVLSGILCGLAGYLIGAGLDQTVTANSVKGRGFTAILVSWLAKFNPLVMILTSSIVVLLESGADKVCEMFDCSESIGDVMVGIVLLFIIGSEFFINYKVHFRSHKDVTRMEVVK